MVALTVTAAISSAVDAYNQLRASNGHSEYIVNDHIQHHDLISIVNYLSKYSSATHEPETRWRLDAVLKGSSVHRQPAPPAPEKTAEYKALMARLRHQEEQRQYERMLNPAPQRETFQQRFPNASSSFMLHSHNAGDDVDEVSYADVNRQMILIINVLVSIIACSIAVWIAARRWNTPQRLGLSFFSSTVVAIAEVAIYMGYIHRIKTAKAKEIKKVEVKKVVDTWVIDHKTSSAQPVNSDNIRFRKGKHR